MFPIRDTIPSRSFPLVTWGLILLNCLIFLFELSLPPRQLEHFFEQFGLVPAHYSQVDWTDINSLLSTDFWPFLTMMFVHGGWLHIIGNMWFLYLFGDNVEDRMGSARFLFFYLLCGLCASIIQYASYPQSDVPNIGASGAIAGVMGAYLVLFPQARIITLILIVFIPWIVEIPAVFFLGIWALTQLFDVLTISPMATHGGIAFWAHVGGFVVGILLLSLFLQPQKEAPRPVYPDEYQPW
jgi:membrane associated rhomboid family serine protease